MPGDAVEDVDHVQRHGQCHATMPLGLLDQGSDTGDSVGRRPSPPRSLLLPDYTMVSSQAVRKVATSGQGDANYIIMNITRDHRVRNRFHVSHDRSNIVRNMAPIVSHSTHRYYLRNSNVIKYQNRKMVEQDVQV